MPDSRPEPSGVQAMAPGRRRDSITLVLGGLFASFGLSSLVVVLFYLLGHPGGTIVLLISSEIGLWIGFIFTCRLISTRYGSGNLRRDFNLRFRWYDLLIGLIGAIVGRLIAALVVSPFSSGQSSTNPDQLFGLSTNSILNWAVLTLLVCVGAPFFEELFFRGLLQGELVARFGPWVAVPLTALTFGAAHIFNAPGFDGVIYAISISGGGLVLGLVYLRFHRLGASMATHVFFNAMALAALATATIR